MPPVMENVKTASHEVRLADGIKMTDHFRHLTKMVYPCDPGR